MRFGRAGVGPSDAATRCTTARDEWGCKSKREVNARRARRHSKVEETKGTRWNDRTTWEKENSSVEQTKGTRWNDRTTWEEEGEGGKILKTEQQRQSVDGWESDPRGSKARHTPRGRTQ
jgi:hypothetical protein